MKQVAEILVACDLRRGGKYRRRLGGSSVPVETPAISYLKPPRHIKLPESVLYPSLRKPKVRTAFVVEYETW